MTVRVRGIVAVVLFWAVFALALRGAWIASAAIEAFVWGGLAMASLLAIVAWLRTGIFAPYSQRMFDWFFDEDRRR